MIINNHTQNNIVFQAVYPENFLVENQKERSIFSKLTHEKIGQQVLTAQSLCKNIDMINKAFSFNIIKGENIKLLTPDKVQIDAMYFSSGEAADLCNRTAIIFNQNASCYEQIAQDISQDYVGHSWNILFFNYRNVVESGLIQDLDGKTQNNRAVATKIGLILDGITAYQYIASKGVADKYILLYGQSLGGWVASHVACLYPNTNYWGDRTFISLAKFLEHRDKGISYLNKLASKALIDSGWNSDVSINLEKNNGFKGVSYHEKDTFIPKGAHLHEFLPIDTEKLALVDETDNDEKRKKCVAHTRFFTESERKIYFNKINFIGNPIQISPSHATINILDKQ